MKLGTQVMSLFVKWGRKTKVGVLVIGIVNGKH